MDAFWSCFISDWRIHSPGICDKDVKLFQRKITKPLSNFILIHLNKITNLILGKHCHQTMHFHLWARYIKIRVSSFHMFGNVYREITSNTVQR